MRNCVVQVQLCTSPGASLHRIVHMRVTALYGYSCVALLGHPCTGECICVQLWWEKFASESVCSSLGTDDTAFDLRVAPSYLVNA